MNHLRPSPTTDAYEDGIKRNVPIIFLAGPIKYWWSCWGSDLHVAYMEHRDNVRRVLIDAGYMTYAPWDAIKGTWNERAQAINNVAISTSDLFLELSPEGVPRLGTLAEKRHAERMGVYRFWVPPGTSTERLLDGVWLAVGNGASWETGNG